MFLYIALKQYKNLTYKCLKNLILIKNSKTKLLEFDSEKIINIFTPKQKNKLIT